MPEMAPILHYLYPSATAAQSPHARLAGSIDPRSLRIFPVTISRGGRSAICSNPVSGAHRHVQPMQESDGRLEEGTMHNKILLISLSIDVAQKKGDENVTNTNTMVLLCSFDFLLVGTRMLKAEL